MVAAISSTRSLYRRASRRSTRTLGVMLLVLVRAGDARLAPLDRPRLLPLPAVRVRQGAVRALPRGLPRRRVPKQIGTLACRSARSGSPRSDLLVFVQPDIGTALVYIAALAAALFVVGSPLAAPGAIARRPLRGPRVLWWLPAAGSTCSSRTRRSASTGVQHPDSDPRARRTTSRSRSPPSARGASAGAASRRHPDAAKLPCRARDDSRSPRSPSKRGLPRRLDPAHALLLVVWRGEGSSQRRCDLSAPSSPAGSCSRSCSRCS
jgi:hypothetical protein